MKKESSINLQRYSGMAEQMIKMISDCPEITKIILDVIYGDERTTIRFSALDSMA